MKPTVSRTFSTIATPDQAFDYLADFRNAGEWDPGTLRCELIQGDGDVGSVYRNRSSFLGREVEVTYTARELDRPTRVHLTGHNHQFDGHDVFGIRAAAGGAEITYTAEFAFSGTARLVAPLVAAYLPRLADKTVDQLRSCLDALEATV